MSHTKNEPNIGALIEGDATRDAIHIAVAPVIASMRLSPGQSVALNEEGHAAANLAKNDIGIVDPFLDGTVSKGDKFWLFLFPRTITSLHHVWEHPAFPLPKATPTPIATSEQESEAWLRAYAKRVNTYDNDEEAYRNLIEGARRHEIYYHGTDLQNAGDLEEPEELFKHLSVILGRPVGIADFEYSCSC